MLTGLIRQNNLIAARSALGSTTCHDMVIVDQAKRNLIYKSIKWLNSLKSGPDGFKRISIKNKSGMLYVHRGRGQTVRQAVHSENLICELITNNTKLINGISNIDDRILLIHNGATSLYSVQETCKCDKCDRYVLNETFFMHKVFKCEQLHLNRGSTFNMFFHDVPEWYSKAVDVYRNTMHSSMSFIEYMKAIIEDG